LHGLGDSSDGFSDLFQSLNLPHTKIVLPNAPVRPITINGGMEMQAWYDILGMDRILQSDTKGIKASTLLINDLLDMESKVVGSKNVLIGGFSQGGAMAIHNGLAYSSPLAAIVSCSGYLIEQNEYPTRINKENLKTPVLAYHGDSDPMVPVQFATGGYNLLKKHGANVEIITEDDLEHSMSPKELRHLVTFFKTKLGI